MTPQEKEWNAQLDRMEKNIEQQSHSPLSEEVTSSEIAKMVWSYLTYTECAINGVGTTVIEIKNVWGLISDLEAILKVKQDTIDFNVRENISLIKKVYEMSNQNKNQ